LPRPEVLIAVERRRSHPIVERKRMRVADAQAPLLGRIHEENAAERPERLAAERLFRLLIENDDRLARFGELSRCDQAGQTGPHDDHVGIVSHRFAPYAIITLKLPDPTGRRAPAAADSGAPAVTDRNQNMPRCSLMTHKGHPRHRRQPKSPGRCRGFSKVAAF
jgi:hypothetical protein